MESVTRQQFSQYLSVLGFPPFSIVYEPVFQPTGSGRGYRPDLAIIDPKTKELLAVIEIKSSKDTEPLSRTIQQVKQYVDAFGDRAVRGFVVTPAQSGEGFIFYTPGEDGKPEEVPSSFIQLESLSSARIAERKEILINKKETTTDHFQTICFVSAIIAVILAVADFVCSLCGIKLLSNERMALVGAAIALVILPYIQKFKGLGIEIERVTKQSKD